MKTWTLVWFLVFPPTQDNPDTTWEFGYEEDMTYVACISEIAEKEVEYRGLILDDVVLGYEVYCKDQRGTPVPVEQR